MLVPGKYVPANPGSGVEAVTIGPDVHWVVPVTLSPGTTLRMDVKLPLRTTTVGSSHVNPGGLEHSTVIAVAEENVTVHPGGRARTTGPPDGVDCSMVTLKA
jgi:hypothetical protein